MPTSIANLNAQRLAAKRAGGSVIPQRSEYEVLDAAHNPQFTGLNTYMRDGKQYVMLADVEARFYLDMGAIVKVETVQ